MAQIVRVRSLKRISWNIVGRIILSLYHENKIKKTNLSMKCNMAYDKCMLYLEWMELMDLIKREIDESGIELIILQDKGREICKKFSLDIT